MLIFANTSRSFTKLLWRLKITLFCNSYLRMTNNCLKIVWRALRSNIFSCSPAVSLEMQVPLFLKILLPSRYHVLDWPRGERSSREVYLTNEIASSSIIRAGWLLSRFATWTDANLSWVTNFTTSIIAWSWTVLLRKDLKWTTQIRKTILSSSLLSLLVRDIQVNYRQVLGF